MADGGLVDGDERLRPLEDDAYGVRNRFKQDAIAIFRAQQGRLHSLAFHRVVDHACQNPRCRFILGQKVLSPFLKRLDAQSLII